MLEKSLQLTVQRVAAESQSGKAPGATTSIFKLVGSTVAKGARRSSLICGVLKVSVGKVIRSRPRT